MRNIKLTLAYDGTDFCGWQIQPGQPTVQGLLIDVLHEITQERPAVYGAGRTDAGVHAWGQVANFTTNSKLTTARLLRALNALLPDAIRVRFAEEVSENFHARWLAQAKTYRYRIFQGGIVPPFSRRYVLDFPQPLDFAAMAEAARCFEGRHDFASFAASTGSEEEDRERTTLRTIYRSELLPAREFSPENSPGIAQADLGSVSGDGEFGASSGEWVYLVRGQSFLRHMVRKIVGSLLEVGRGRLVPQDIPRLIECRDPGCSGPTAAPEGLCLLSVEYPSSANALPNSAAAASADVS